MLKHLSIRFLLFSFLFLFVYTQARIIDTNYGPIDVKEQVILDLLDHPAMQRLKYIHQYGGGHYVIHNYEYHRLEHSIGVFALLRRFNAPLKEQIAGLLHDVSHTIFSHVGDHFFEQNAYGDSYQDNIHEWYLQKTGIGDVLLKHGYQIKDVLHKNKEFTQLEQPLPNICADRLEYVLWGGYLEGVLTHNDIDEILNNLQFNGKDWYFVDQEAAYKFAYSSLFLTKHLFTSQENAFCNTLMSRILHCAVDNNILTLDDIHFGHDDDIWKKLRKSQNSRIKTYVKQLYNLHTLCCTRNIAAKETIHVSSKFRGINPWIQTEAGLERLTHFNTLYNNKFNKLREHIVDGWNLQLVCE